ncbi:MAG: metallophosphoesterase, partial [Candidatus Thorarchaeota archaeon]
MKSNTLFLVNPNLGHPKVLNINNNFSQQNFETGLLIISDIDDVLEIKKDLENKIKFIPILDYKWKLEQIIKKKGLKERIKSLFKTIIKFFSIKKKVKFIEIPIEELDKFGNQKRWIEKIKKKDIKKINPRAFRSSAIIVKILKVESTYLTKINNPIYIKDQYCKPQEILRKLNVFGRLANFYVVNIEFSLTDEILQFLKEKTFVMFDILFKNSDHSNSINYHSLIVSRNNWNEFKILQATDLHLAKRNDEMYSKIDKMYRDIRKENIKKINKIKNNNSKSEEKKNIKKTLEKIDLSFRKRLINPNNLFRIFIKEVNKRVINNEVDFVFVTGDIVDFSVKSLVSPKAKNIFEFEQSNWKFFKNILLNINQPQGKGIKQTEEILCPIFTILGNHDYRPWQYDLKWGGIYKKVGLKKKEARVLKEEYSASPIKAILKSEHSLKGYLREINPSLDFYLNLGSFILIFINTGADSYKKMTDFISGSPSLTGITQRQVEFLNNIIKYKFNKNFKVILCLHAPPVNTKFKRSLFNRIKKIYKKLMRIKIEQFKESKFKNLKRKRDKSRIDDKFNIRFGTISSNWEKLIRFCSDYCTLTISGHTHLLNEYRLEKIFNKNETSIAVYYDDYSKIYNNKELIEAHNPFIVQTPALGLKSFKKSTKI